MSPIWSLNSTILLRYEDISSYTSFRDYFIANTTSANVSHFLLFYSRLKICTRSIPFQLYLSRFSSVAESSIIPFSIHSIAHLRFSRIHLSITQQYHFRFIIPALPSINSGPTVACVFIMADHEEHPVTSSCSSGHGHNIPVLLGIEYPLFWQPGCVIRIEDFKRWDSSRQIDLEFPMETS